MFGKLARTVVVGSVCAALSACATTKGGEVWGRYGVGPEVPLTDVALVLPVNGRLGWMGVKQVNGQKVLGKHGVALPAGTYVLDLFVFETDDNPVVQTTRTADAQLEVTVEAGHAYGLQREDAGGTSVRPIVKLYDLGKGRQCGYARGGVAGYLTCDGEHVYLY